MSASATVRGAGILTSVPFAILFALILTLGAAPAGAQVQSCRQALGPEAASNPPTTITLEQSGDTTVEGVVDEWESDVFRLRIAASGTVTVTSEINKVKGSLSTGDPSAGEHKLLDEGRLGAVGASVKAAAQPRDYCLQVDSHAGLTGSYRLRIAFANVCDGVGDDHGDNFRCATKLALAQLVAGEIENATADDQDAFSFTLNSRDTVAVESFGTTSVAASLYDEDGALLASQSGPGANFRIVKTLNPGRYFVRVEGRSSAEGLYQVSVTGGATP